LLNIARDFLRLKKLFIIAFTSTLTCPVALSQKSHFSFTTDASVLRSLNENQKYWAIGQTLNFLFHFMPTDGAYAWFSYYSKGHINNVVNANAKSSTTVPQQVKFQNKSELSFEHVSLGWRHYLKGRYDAESKWNLYAYAGFGLMMGTVSNTQSTSIDTSLYHVPVLSGKGYFKRLTFDLGVGAEVPVGADVFAYLEARTLIPTTDYPSPYLLVNDNAPFTLAVNIGVRILFPD